jgi:hypothetical protein
VQKHSARVRAITTFAGTSKLYCRESPRRAPFTLLDFGCGSGRDLKTFRELGHVAIGLEGAASFATMARADTGCEVWQQDFLALDLPVGASTAYSQTLACSTFPWRRCRGCCANCARH